MADGRAVFAGVPGPDVFLAPVLEQVNERAFQPYMNGKIATDQALAQGMKPLREFMVRQTRDGYEVENDS